MSNQWIGIKNIILRYWQNYGGFRAIIRSPYFHLAILFTIFTIPFWFYRKWWDQILSIIPSILGFTLGGFAIFLGYGNDKFRSLMAKKDSTGNSPYLNVVSSFLHFVIVQILALIFSLTANSMGAIDALNIETTNRSPCISFFWFIIGFIGYGSFLYSLFLAFAVSFALYRLASIYVEFETRQTDKTSNL